MMPERQSFANAPAVAAPLVSRGKPGARAGWIRIGSPYRLTDALAEWERVFQVGFERADHVFLLTKIRFFELLPNPLAPRGSPQTRPIGQLAPHRGGGAPTTVSDAYTER